MSQTFFGAHYQWYYVPQSGTSSNGMNIQAIKRTNIALTEAIKNYVEKRLGELDRVLTHLGEPQNAHVEVGMISNHHKNGDIFRFEINLKVPGQLLRASFESSNLYKSIDLGKDELERQIRSLKEKLLSKKRRDKRGE